jgi:hypothetical protein
MLALAPGVGYIHEPFNPCTEPGISAAPFDHFFTYVTAENEQRYVPGLERTLGFRFNWNAQVRALRSPRQAVRATLAGGAFTRARAMRARPLVKDPIALFSAEWFAERFGMDVVVTVRNPLAFAASLKQHGWTHRFETWAADELLLRDHLGCFSNEVRSFAVEPRDIVAQAILLWNVLYTAAARFRDRQPDWIFVRHEDVARDPVIQFEQLYARLGLEFDAAARRGVERHSASENPVVARGRHEVRLNSVGGLENWRTRLTVEEIERVREGTARVAGLFYPDDEWLSSPIGP